MTATWKAYADWDGDGDFTGPEEDITDRVLDGRTQLTVTYGRDLNRALSPTRVGEAGFELNNIDRALSPENTASPLYGQVLPARKVRIDAELGATTYTPFAGITDDFTLKLGIDQRSVDVTCVDGLSALRGVQITTQLYQGLRTGQALHVILDAVGWPVADRDIDAGATVMPHWWVDNGDAFEAAMQLLDSEGPPSLLTCDSDRRIVYRDRHHRVTRAASLTAQATWYDDAVEPMFSAPAEYNHGWKEIINVISFEVPMRVASPSLEVVWTAPSRITIASGQTLNVTVKGSSPFFAALVPVAGTDYTATGTVTVSMSRTSGESSTVALTAPSGVAYVDNLQVRGFLLTQAGSMVVSGEDASVGPPRNYGRRSSTNLRPPVWAGQYDAQAVLDLTLAQRAERLATITVTMVAANDTRQTQQLTRDLSDRVRIVETHSGLDGDCFIEQISHTVTQGGAEHRTKFGLERAPAQITGAFVLGSSLLGTGVLGRRGFADPDRIFILGSATNGQLGTDILAA